jgi:hypothetical protein
MATNPTSPDFLNFCRGKQPLVDAVFLAHGILRAKTQLWTNAKVWSEGHIPIDHAYSDKTLY